MKRILIPVAMIVSMVGLIAGPASASTNALTVIYKSTVTPLPGNLPSVGAEAYSFNEFGDEVTFAGTHRNVKKAIVTLSSWGCESGHWNTADCSTTPGDTFSVPITLNIYHASSKNGSGQYLPGSLIATVTQTFAVPYRPSASPLCTGADAGKWFKNGQGCFNGLAKNVTFKFPFRNVDPDTVVYGIAYNTTHYGYNPIGESAPCYTGPGGCPYDSLNIALSPAVTVGSQAHPGTVFQNAAYQADYCDGTPAVGTFNLDSPTMACWAGYVPAIQFSAR
jgi:hypothetical protein